MSRDQKRRQYGFQNKMADVVSPEFDGKTLGLTPSNLSKTMVARFFNVHEEDLHQRWCKMVKPKTSGVVKW